MFALRSLFRKPIPSGYTKKKLVVLGCGWGGFHVAKYVDKSLYDVRVISPTNHFLFTPLLPSTAVGTLEFRCIQEPVRTIDGLAGYYQAKARAIDFEKRIIVCEDQFHKEEVDIPYDILVIATGAKTNTFNTPGVDEREGKDVFFLKHLHHARAIRNRIVELFEHAAVPGISENERRALLSFVVVGGGPTSIEFTGELYDFLKDDVSRWFPDLKDLVTVTIVEASSHILGSFDQSLSGYVTNTLRKRNISIRLNTAVVSIEDAEVLSTPNSSSNFKASRVVLSDKTNLPFGMLVWSAGIKQIKLIERLNFLKGKTGRILVDNYLRVLPRNENDKTDFVNRIYAIGDCAVNTEVPLTPLAKVAQQQGKYLANRFNSIDPNDLTNGVLVPKKNKEFVFFNAGSMAQIGSWKAVIDMSHLGTDNVHAKGPVVKGISAFLTWRSAYLGMQVSWANKLLIPMHWLKTLLFGRDISRF
eukprot:c16999_g1_i1.p1 GENE.c16999_g1_i1~~c16999_g1_i1.p1  ORF type:complete len:472 (-),score=194.58 c16999_g1_i1:98-1513(-)